MSTLPLPNLDDRRWVDLVEEGRALIPFHAPGWTDHNAHDPGISLIELFAWVAEMDLYALNRLTDAQRRKLLSLAGTSPRPPQPANAVISVRLQPGQAAFPLPGGVELQGNDPSGLATRFRTRHGVTLQPGQLTAVVVGAGPELLDVTAALGRGEPVAAFGRSPSTGDALHLGFDLAGHWPAGAEVSLGFVVAGDEVDHGAVARSRLRAAAEAALSGCPSPWERGCGCPDDEGAAPLDQPEPELAPGAKGAPGDGGDGHDGLVHHSARLVWELMTGPGRWTRFPEGAVVEDGTRSLTLDGRVVLRLPAAPAAGPLGQHGSALSWIRVRLVRGAFDAAPELVGVALNALLVEQAVPAVVRLRLAPGAPVSGSPPAPGSRVDLDLEVDHRGDVVRLGFGPTHAGPAAVRVLDFDPVEGRLVLEAGAVAAGWGEPGQVLEVAEPPLVAEGVTVHSLEQGRWRPWSVRPDLDASGRADAHVLVEPTSGRVSLGDGERGRVAPRDSTLVATTLLTRGDAGNLPTAAIDRLADSPGNRALLGTVEAVEARLAWLRNVAPAAGGEAAESLDAAVARARHDREAPSRAVTLDDYVTLARGTPGTRLARAEARANLHPGFPCIRAAGVVTVLILPHLPAGRPEPSPGLRRAVATHLGRVRPLGTRVEVAGPSYVTVAVRATVEARPEAPVADLPTLVVEALDRFFHPLTGGPHGSGWPFGRDVHRSEVLAVIDEVAGVAHVLELELEAGGEATCGDVCLGPLGLVDSGAHVIEVRRAGADRAERVPRWT